MLIGALLLAGCASAGGDAEGPGAPLSGDPSGSGEELALRSPDITTTTTVAAPPTLSDGAIPTEPPVAPGSSDAPVNAVPAQPGGDDPAAPAPEPDAEPAPDPAPGGSSPSPGHGREADPMAPPDEAELASGEARSLVLLNDLRAASGLEPVHRKAELDAYARDWSRQMAVSGDFVHSAGSYGENIAFTSDTSLTADEAAERFQELWAGDPDHLANMMSPQFSNLGIGLYRTEYGWYGTHVFIY